MSLGTDSTGLGAEPNDDALVVAVAGTSIRDFVAAFDVTINLTDAIPGATIAGTTSFAPVRVGAFEPNGWLSEYNSAEWTTKAKVGGDADGQGRPGNLVNSIATRWPATSSKIAFASDENSNERPSIFPWRIGRQS